MGRRPRREEKRTSRENEPVTRSAKEVVLVKRSWRQVLIGVVATLAGVGLIVGAFSGWSPLLGVLGVIVFMAGVSVVARQGFRADQQEQAFRRSQAEHQAPPTMPPSMPRR